MMKTAINKRFIGVAVMLLGVCGTYTVRAQEKVEVSVGADVVSSYIWRGIDSGGLSVQPSITVAKCGLSLTAWGSVGLDRYDTKEFDLTLGYSTGGFGVAITDYWFDTEKYYQYGAHSTAHVYEGTVGYDFGAVALVWNTNVAGSDYYKANGKRAYSTYIEASAPFKLGGIDFAAEVGFTPWEGAYSDGLNVTNVGLKASKELQITNSFSVPVFAKVITNPYTEGTYFVFGLSF
jgi:hypothetical protein